MSFTSELRNRCCFEWKVERPLENSDRVSPEFYIEGHPYQLEFYQRSITGYYLNLDPRDLFYYLYLKPLKRPDVISDFKVTVHVQDKYRRALPLSGTCEGSDYVSFRLWSYSESAILKAKPDFYQNGMMAFLVVIDSGEDTYQFTFEPPSKKIKVDSVQTPSFLSIDPCLESLSADLSKLLEQDSRPDVALVCGDLNLKAHRSVLSCRSEVFSAMLNNDMTEGRTGQVQIEDMDSGDFEPFVRYLYTGKLPELTEDSARRLYEAADKYAVVGLQKRCASFFLEILSRENACEMLCMADAHSDVDFKDSVVCYILEKKIHLSDDIWPPFCASHSLLATEVLNRFCKLSFGKDCK